MTADAKVLKPKLTIDEQIERLKAKGVTFERCTEPEAAAYLTNINYYFRVTAYRTLFEKRVGGAHDGEYVGLDFADLIELCKMDQRLRDVLLSITLSIENLAKTKLMSEVTSRPDEDGYSIVTDYWSDLSEAERNRRILEINRLKADEYVGRIASKYEDQMPLWVYLELMSFGTLVNLYRFCADRWQSKELRQTHGLLHNARSLRNACAHSSCLLNGMLIPDSVHPAQSQVIIRMRELGFSKRVVRARFKSKRLRQIGSSLYAYERLTFCNESDEYDERDVIDLCRMMDELESLHRSNTRLSTLMAFLTRLLTGCLLDPYK